MNFRTLGSIGAVPTEEACFQGHSLVGAAVPVAILPVAAFLSGRRTIIVTFWLTISPLSRNQDGGTALALFSTAAHSVPEWSSRLTESRILESIDFYPSVVSEQLYRDAVMTLAFWCSMTARTCGLEKIAFWVWRSLLMRNQARVQQIVPGHCVCS